MNNISFISVFVFPSFFLSFSCFVGFFFFQGGTQPSKQFQIEKKESVLKHWTFPMFDIWFCFCFAFVLKCEIE